MNDGRTPERSDVPSETVSDPCVRAYAEGTVRKGKHAWAWKDLLKVQVCQTCGEVRRVEDFAR